MKLAFTKMSGAGNDFILVDNRHRELPLDSTTIAALCDRHFGIGADGLLAVEPSDNGADFRMRYYNADGGEADMCGNGARCFARFVKQINPGTGDFVSFGTPAGVVRAQYLGEDIEVNLTDPTDLRLHLSLSLKEGDAEVHHVNTGVPHAIRFVEDLEKLPIREKGREIREHSAFAPAGVNANFVQRLDEDLYGIRTYERGVEDETLACGTGVCAAAIVAHLVDQVPVPIRVQVRGGDVLSVNFQTAEAGAIREVSLRGPANVTFSGEVDLSTLRQPRS